MQQAFDVHFWLLTAVDDARERFYHGSECLSRCVLAGSFSAGCAVKPWAPSTASVGCPGVDMTMMGGVLLAGGHHSLRRYVVRRY